MTIAFTLPAWLLVTAVLFVLGWTIQFVIQLLVHRAPLRHAKKEAGSRVVFSDNQPSVSVIVYAHNQAEELLRNIPLILDNDYPDFEVIVVDDGSTDFTSDVLTQMQQRSERFSHTTLAQGVRNVSHCKMAMMLGVKAARHEVVLMTQAQCMPVSPQWIANMVRQLNNKTEVVLGPVVYEARVGTMNRFYQWDQFQRLCDMMGITLAVAPYGGFATNMAFHKRVFYANHNAALSGHLNIHPGHDDLFVKSVYRDDNVVVECSRESLVLNQQSPLGYAWNKERLNRAFTSKCYLMPAMLVKRLDSLSRYLTTIPGWLLLAYGLWCQMWSMLMVVLLLLGIHYLLLMLTPYQFSKHLGIHRYVLSPLLSELLTPLVDVWYRLRTIVSPDQFYVGRIGKL